MDKILINLKNLERDDLCYNTRFLHRNGINIRDRLFFVLNHFFKNNLIYDAIVLRDFSCRKAQKHRKILKYYLRNAVKCCILV